MKKDFNFHSVSKGISPQWELSVAPIFVCSEIGYKNEHRKVDEETQGILYAFYSK